MDTCAGTKFPPKMPVAKWVQVQWVDIEEVESPDDSLRKQAMTRGQLFARGEGMWYGNGSIYWACTNGGPFMRGQSSATFQAPTKALYVNWQTRQLYIDLMHQPD